ncbi:hypothetical protein HDU96_003832 [Phlyctochytrium bullatum]|nr:hypothetical protein HDU96_003832 [Phlyctochytrium bullatum]
MLTTAADTASTAEATAPSVPVKRPLDSTEPETSSDSKENAPISSPTAAKTTAEPAAESRNVRPKTMQMSLGFTVKLTPEQEKYLELEKRTMAKDWYDAFLGEMRKPYFIGIKKKLEQEKAAKQTIYPAEDEIYSFTRCALKDIKVVILGQDPYHGPGQAHGLCFSVKKGVPPPPSLNNIFKELQSDLGSLFTTPTHGDLTGWSTQGVLLLNASLTVRAHQAASHATFGWTTFTDAIVAHLNRHGEGIVFILWGGHAQKKKVGIDGKKHLVLCAAHPSPLSAHRGFFGCKHFSKANAWLEEKGRKGVEWGALP